MAMGQASHMAVVVKNLLASAGVHKRHGTGSIPGSGRSLGEGNGDPLQYSCLGNPMDRGARWATMGLQRVGHDLATKQQYFPLSSGHL